MSKSSKLLLGLLSILPLILKAVIIIQVFSFFPDMIYWGHNEPDPYTVFTTMSPVFITAIITGVITVGLLIFFIVHMLNNKKIESGERIIWIIVFLLAGSVGYPIYWYLRIWKDEI
ncbi:MAG: hypothetical protein ACM3H8_00405 [Sphingobacteriales bacterium]